MSVRASIVVVLAASTAGCFQSEPLSQGDLAQYWYLQEDLWPQAKAGPFSLGPWKLPGKWTLRQDPSLIWSTVSIVRELDKMARAPEPPDELDMRISPTHARMVNLLLDDARRAVEDLRAMAVADSPVSAKLWSSRVAEVLVTAESVVRRVDEEARTGERERRGSPLDWSAGPLLEFVSAYLDSRTGGLLLEDLGKEEVGRLRVVLAQIVLRLSFAIRRTHDPPGLRAAIVRRMDQAESPACLAGVLRRDLEAALADAPPADTGTALAALLTDVLDAAPLVIETLQSFLRQWDRMESLTLERRTLGGGATTQSVAPEKSSPDEPWIAAVTFRVRKGKEIRLARLFRMQPTILIRGGCRVVVQPKQKGRNEDAILFEPLDGGGAEIRFEGIGYGVVRLLGLPLDDGRLREIRWTTPRAPGGPRRTSVALVMEARGAEDPRRIIAYQDVRQRRRRGRPFALGAETVYKEQTFSYITPRRRYVYRLSGP